MVIKPSNLDILRDFDLLNRAIIDKSCPFGKRAQVEFFKPVGASQAAVLTVLDGVGPAGYNRVVRNRQGVNAKSRRASSYCELKFTFSL